MEVFNMNGFLPMSNKCLNIPRLKLSEDYLKSIKNEIPKCFLNQDIDDAIKEKSVLKIIFYFRKVSSLSNEMNDLLKKILKDCGF